MRMEMIAFRMILHPGQAEEYRKRHDAIDPALARLLKEAGASDYSIWLDEETSHLFAILKRPKNHTMDHLPEEAVVRRWWDFMADLMETNPDRSPVCVPLTEVFHAD